MFNNKTLSIVALTLALVLLLPSAPCLADTESANPLAGVPWGQQIVSGDVTVMISAFGNCIPSVPCLPPAYQPHGVLVTIQDAGTPPAMLVVEALIETADGQLTRYLEVARWEPIEGYDNIMIHTKTAPVRVWRLLIIPVAPGQTHSFSADQEQP